METTKAPSLGAFFRPQLICLLWIGYFFVAPNFSFTRLLSYDEQRLGQLLLLALTVLLSGAGLLNLPLSRLRTATRLLLGIFFALGLFSAAQAALFRWAGMEWGLNYLLCFALVTLAGCRMVAGEKADRWMIFAVALPIPVYITGVLAAYLAVLAGSAPYNQWLLFHNFSNPRFLGQWTTLTLPLLALLPLLLRRPLYRNTAWGLLAAWWALLLATGTRGSMMGLAGGAFLSFWAGHAFLPLLKTQIKGLLGGLVGYALFFLAIPELLWHELPSLGASDNLARAGLSGRGLLWSQAWHFITAHPWLGIGPMQFAAHPNPYGAHPHNFILMYAAEWGVPAALILLALLTHTYLSWISRLRVKKNNDFTDLLSIALLWSIGACLTQGLVDGTTVTPYTQTLLVALSGWALGSHLSTTPPNTTSKSMLTTSRLLWLGAILTVLYIAIAAMPSFVTLWDRAYVPGEQTPVYVYPRFWADGWI